MLYPIELWVHVLGSRKVQNHLAFWKSLSIFIGRDANNAMIMRPCPDGDHHSVNSLYQPQGGCVPKPRVGQRPTLGMAIVHGGAIAHGREIVWRGSDVAIHGNHHSVNIPHQPHGVVALDAEIAMRRTAAKKVSSLNDGILIDLSLLSPYGHLCRYTFRLFGSVMVVGLLVLVGRWTGVIE